MNNVSTMMNTNQAKILIQFLQKKISYILTNIVLKLKLFQKNITYIFCEKNLKYNILQITSPGLHSIFLFLRKILKKMICASHCSVFYCKLYFLFRETIYRYTTTASELNRDYYSMVKAIRSLTVSPQGRLTYYNTSDQ